MAGLAPQPPAASWIGDRFLRLSFGTSISIETQERVWNACSRLKAANLANVEDITTAFTTAMVTFSTPPEAFDKVAARIVDEVLKHPMAIRANARYIEIPVCYAESFAPDLADVAALHDLTPEALIDLHSSAAYAVAFLGFTPGFPYLLGLPAQLATPRLSSPRVRVPAGSVAIAGDQCGIYPGDTSGGWRIVGRTPIKVFDPQRTRQALLSAGDSVRFRPVSVTEFEMLKPS